MNNANNPLFAVSNLQGGYGDIQILNGVSINVPEKNIVTIVGPNGGFKSHAGGQRAIANDGHGLSV